MSTAAGNLSRHRFFDEFNSAQIDARGGVLISPAAQKARAVTNLGFTATAAQISAAALGTTAPVLIGDVTSYNVLAADSGKTHIIPDLTSTCTFTFPAGFAGAKYTFIGNGVALDAANWVFTAPAGVFYRGGVTHLDLDAGAGADELVSVFPNGTTHITLTVNTPSPMSRISFEWDGTRYVVNGTVHSNTAPAFS